MRYSTVSHEYDSQETITRMNGLTTVCVCKDSLNECVLPGHRTCRTETNGSFRAREEGSGQR